MTSTDTTTGDTARPLFPRPIVDAPAGADYYSEDRRRGQRDTPVCHLTPTEARHLIAALTEALREEALPDTSVAGS